MAKFLTQAEIYRVIQRELPQDAYADGNPSKFLSTADSDATAKVLRSAYSNLERIDVNNFPQDADEKIAAWETFVFGVTTTGLTLTERQDLVVAKLRERKSLSLFSMLTAVLEIVPFGITVEIFELKNTIGLGWQLGLSKLGLDTRLGGQERIILDSIDQYCEVPTFDFWTLGRSKLGTTTILAAPTGGFRSEDWFLQRFKAYSFEIRVFTHTLTAAETTAINNRINAIMPRRSFFILRDAQDLAGRGFTTVVLDIDEFNLINVAFKDAASTVTGISGRTL